MLWNDHSKLQGLHAFLGASQYHWINWDDETLEKRFRSSYATEIGTIIHELASECIKNKIKIGENDVNLIEFTLAKNGIPKSVYDSSAILNNLIPFVNEAINYHMSSEVLLYFSKYCFGTADAISYDEVNKILRIHDYKSGKIEAHMEQLKIYAALFCLEYHKDPKKMKQIELRIFQNSEMVECILTPDTQEIDKFMKLIQDTSRKAQLLFERG